MLSKWLNVEIRACKICRCPLNKISLHYQAVIGQSLTVFYQLFSWTSVGPSKCRLTKWLARKAIWQSEEFPEYHVLESFKDNSVEINKFPKKEAIKFINCMIMRKAFSCCCDLIISQSDSLTSCLRSKFYDQCSSDDILSQGHVMVLSFPYDIEKH